MKEKGETVRLPIDWERREDDGVDAERLSNEIKNAARTAKGLGAPVFLDLGDSWMRVEPDGRVRFINKEQEE